MNKYIFTKKQLEQEQNFKDTGIFFVKRGNKLEIISGILIIAVLITLVYLTHKYFISVESIVSGL